MSIGKLTDMYPVFRLEELTFYYLVRNFQASLKINGFKEMFKNHKLSTQLYNRLFRELNRYYDGITDDMADAFSSEYTSLTELHLTDKNTENEATHGEELRVTALEFLKRHPFQSLNIEYLSKIAVESILYRIQKESVFEINIIRSKFELKEELFNIHRKRKNDQDYQIFSICQSPKFVNVAKLHLPRVKIDNFQFCHLTRHMKNLIDLNISNTSITDFRLLKYFKSLKYLDCTFLSNVFYNGALFLQFLKKLEFLKFGSIISSNSKTLSWSNSVDDDLLLLLNGNEQDELTEPPKKFKSKTVWTFSEFLEKLKLKNLKFFDCDKFWNFEEKSVK